MSILSKDLFFALGKSIFANIFQSVQMSIHRVPSHRGLSKFAVVVQSKTILFVVLDRARVLSSSSFIEFVSFEFEHVSRFNDHISKFELGILLEFFKSCRYESRF